MGRKRRVLKYIFAGRDILVFYLFGQLGVGLEFEDVLHQSVSYELRLGLFVQFFEEIQDMEELIVQDELLHKFRVVALVNQLYLLSLVLVLVLHQ